MKELLKTNAISNPNLLLNSDFKIWQRGEELTVSNGAYCADRWRVYSPNVTSVTFKKVSNGLKVVSTNPVGQSIQIYQLLEHDENLEGVKCTFSQCVNGVVSKRSLTLSNLWGTDKHIQACSISLKEGDVVSWCKTEIGEVATTYVPPNPGDELLKCQRYYLPLRYHNGEYWLKAIKLSGDGNSVELVLPNNLRVNPKIQGTFTYFNDNNAWVDLGGIKFSKLKDCRLKMTFNTELPVENRYYLVKADAELDSEIY